MAYNTSTRLSQYVLAHKPKPIKITISRLEKLVREKGFGWDIIQGDTLKLSHSEARTSTTNCYASLVIEGVEYNFALLSNRPSTVVGEVSWRFTCKRGEIPGYTPVMDLHARSHFYYDSEEALKKLLLVMIGLTFQPLPLEEPILFIDPTDTEPGKIVFRSQEESRLTAKIAQMEVALTDLKDQLERLKG